MVEVTRTNKPLWVKILFETPEFISESLLQGMFPKTRKKIIDLITKILVYYDQRGKKLTSRFRWLERTILLIVEWINNNWKKSIDKNQLDETH